MLRDRIEWKWIETFAHTFGLCRIGSGDEVAILSESQSRQLNVHLAELALLSIGARPFHVVLPTPPQSAPVPVKSTGSSHAIAGNRSVIAALSAVPMVVDMTVEGLMHAPETGAIRGAGTRLLYISDEHPEVLERLRSNAELGDRVRQGRQMMIQATEMHVTSAAGTDLRVGMRGAVVGGNLGFVTEPGQMASWPGGICSCFPAHSAVNGTLVLDRGDVNLTFKRYHEAPVTLTIRDDFVTDIAGDGLDAELMREYFAAWDDRNAYGASHVSWGMNHAARWESLAMYDKRDVNGIEARAVAGSLLYSTGANPSANRFSLGHFDLPLRRCSLTIDGQLVIEEGTLRAPLA